MNPLVEAPDPIGLIGLGLLGSAIAERLLAAGFTVLGHDANPNRIDEFAQSGGTAATAAELAGCSRLLLSLPDATVSAEVIAGIEDRLQSGSIVIDTTTGDPAQMEAIGARLAAKSVAYLDATIGGSSEQCRRKNVVVMCGGDAAAFNQCTDLFDAFAMRTFHLGPCGSGARTKLVFNLVLGLNRAVLAEGLSLAKRFALDLPAVLEILQSGAAHSAVMDAKGEKMIAGNFTPQARLAQHLKDVRLILQNGRDAVLPFSELHERLLQELIAAGLGDADNSAIIRAFDNPHRPPP